MDVRAHRILLTGRAAPAAFCAGRRFNRQTRPVRVTIRVRPGAGRTAVGGSHDGALVVRVAPRAVEGQATDAALAAVAQAFGVRRRDARLISGATSRTKVVEIDVGDGADGPARLRELLGG